MVQMKELYKKLNSKIVIHYTNKKIEEIISKIKEENYEYELLDIIFSTVNNPELITKDYRGKIMEKIEKNNYFIPNLNSEIDESIWRFAHKIWSDMSSFLIEDKKHFLNKVETQFENASELGKYRLNSLNEQSGIISLQ